MAEDETLTELAAEPVPAGEHQAFVDDLCGIRSTQGHLVFTEVDSGVRHELAIGPDGRVQGTLATGVKAVGRFAAAADAGAEQAPHRLTVGLTASGIPWFQLEHTEACDQLKYGQHCPFDDYEGTGGVDDRPKEPGAYLGYYWPSKTWTDMGWEYDARIDWEPEGDDGQ